MSCFGRQLAIMIAHDKLRAVERRIAPCRRDALDAGCASSFRRRATAVVVLLPPRRRRRERSTMRQSDERRRVCQARTYAILKSRDETADRLRVPARCCHFRQAVANTRPMPKRPGMTAMMPPLTPLFAGMTDVVEPATGIVVHPAGGHDTRAPPLTSSAGNGTLARYRMHAVVRQRRRHEGEIAAGHAYRALSEIVLERRHWIAVENAEILEQPCDGAVSESRVAFRSIDGFVDDDVMAEERSHRASAMRFH